MKKNFLLPAFVIILSASVISCKKGDVGPAGPVGPEGSAGQAGAPGATGATGATGTANVTQFSFAAFTHSGSEVTKTFSLSKANFEKSLLYVYVNPGTAYWYPLPGTTAGAARDYRIYFSNPDDNSTRIMIDRLTGAGSETLTMRIVVIPAANEINERLNNNVDLADYLQVAKHYSLPVE